MKWPFARRARIFFLWTVVSKRMATYFFWTVWRLTCRSEVPKILKGGMSEPNPPESSFATSFKVSKCQSRAKFKFAMFFLFFRHSKIQFTVHCTCTFDSSAAAVTANTQPESRFTEQWAPITASAGLRYGQLLVLYFADGQRHLPLHGVFCSKFGAEKQCHVYLADTGTPSWVLSLGDRLTLQRLSSTALEWCPLRCQFWCLMKQCLQGFLCFLATYGSSFSGQFRTAKDSNKSPKPPQRSCSESIGQDCRKQRFADAMSDAHADHAEHILAEKFGSVNHWDLKSRAVQS